MQVLSYTYNTLLWHEFLRLDSRARNQNTVETIRLQSKINNGEKRDKVIRIYNLVQNEAKRSSLVGNKLAAILKCL